MISYSEFSQFLHDFHEECALEAFKSKDPNGSGFISALDFQDTMINVKKHLLTPAVKDNLVSVSKFFFSLTHYATMCLLYYSFLGNTRAQS